MSSHPQNQNYKYPAESGSGSLTLPFLVAILFVIATYWIFTQNDDDNTRSDTTELYNGISNYWLPRSADQLHACIASYDNVKRSEVGPSQQLVQALANYRAKCEAISPLLENLRNISQSFFDSDIPSDTEHPRRVPIEEVEKKQAEGKAAHEKLKAGLELADNSSDKLIFSLLINQISKIPEKSIEDSRFSTRIDNIKKFVKLEDVESALATYNDFRKIYLDAYGVQLPVYKRPGSAIRVF